MDSTSSACTVPPRRPRATRSRRARRSTRPTPIRQPPRRSGPVIVLVGGVVGFALSYGLFTVDAPAIVFLAVPFILAGIGIGAVETAQHSAVAAFAPKDLRGSAFGMLAAVQSFGNLAASTLAGILWTAFSPAAAFAYLTAWMLLALAGLTVTSRILRR